MVPLKQQLFSRPAIVVVFVVVAVVVADGRELAWYFHVFVCASASTAAACGHSRPLPFACKCNLTSWLTRGLWKPLVLSQATRASYSGSWPRRKR